MWISREVWRELQQQHSRAIEAKEAEIEWLRAELAAAYGHRRDLDRQARGLPGQKPQPRKELEPVPEDIMELVRRYPEAAREELLYSIRAARQQNPPLLWAEIKGGISSRLPPPDIQQEEPT